ncbi:aldehyde dehydrogenase (plasmid) [Halostagnicola larsenii XH-48]|uniref:Aldehyde dehydrogenase n=1 Tax=Halostagnicola larsenii XH-48 TaxID=797299 RepID=W0JU15_9EURY|nr:aldehyde dehydrogenase family protein [Halostagnicola larsenii]AHG02084.1 aldehyde dehydrogenase [Halostagnicola larsenii XH-48]
MSIEIKETYELFIDGETVEASSGDYLTTEDPATEEPIAEFAAGTADDVDEAVAAARGSLEEWQAKRPGERGDIVQRIADGIREHAETLTEIETLDQGKPLTASRGAVEGAAGCFEYYAGAADKLEGKSIPVGEDTVDFTMREPYGVSAQIIPWNAPLNLSAQGTAPALVAGNAVVIKPAPTTPLSSLHLAEICKEAGVPDGVINVVTGATEPGAALSSHDGVDTISFTGSVPTGQAVMESAAKTITPVTLELGGKNPAIVLPDADLEEAVNAISIGIFSNTGQICAAADRAIVHESIYDEFVERIVERAEAYTLGPGMEDPDMGPLNHAEHHEKVLDYIDIGLEEGATLETGGKAPEGDGYFVEPTVFSDVRNEMQIAQEEIFGPVLTVIPFSDRAEAVEIANDIELGLTGGVFSNDIKQALQTAREIEAGSIYVNQWFGGSAGTPFGGMKKSGIGREMGLESLDSYLQTKNICIDVTLDE